MKKLLILLLVMLTIPAVLAAVDVEYTFTDGNTGDPILNVNGSAYNCADVSCSRVDPFSGSITKPSGSTQNFGVDDGQITIRYPDTLNQNKYAVFFVSPGYRPKEIKARWHTGGQPGLGPTQHVEYEFTQMPNTCRALVDDLEFVNELKPNIPLVVNTSAKLDGRTSSAFELTQNDIDYLPQEFIQEFYGADTIVRMDVLENGQVIHSQEKEYTAAKGNALIADSSVPIQFKYVPKDNGNYVVRVTASVVDNQCNSNEDMSSEGDFSVLENEPNSQFYTLINKLKVNNTHPKVGEPVLVLYNKITNHAFANGTLTPVQTDVDELAKVGSTTVHSRSRTLPANSGTLNPVTFTFTYTPDREGVHVITVSGEANSAMPTTNPEVKAEQRVNLYVGEQRTHDVTFLVRDSSNGLGIQDANVTIINTGTEATNEFGKAVIQDVAEGNHQYRIVATNYSSKNGNVNVLDGKSVTVLLRPVGRDLEENESADRVANTAPWMNLPNTLEIEQGSTREFNFYNYVDDEQDRPEDMILSVLGGNNTVQVTIDDGRVIFTAGSPATEYIDFQLNDTWNATARDTVEIIVRSSSTSTLAPSFGSIPDVTVYEDNAAVKVRNLRQFVQDADTPRENLIFTVESVNPSSLMTAELDDGYFLSVYPKPDQFGNGTVTVNVTDGQRTDSTTVNVMVNGLNDAPVVISVPQLIVTPESTSVTINLSEIFYDADNDPLTYYVFSEENLSFDVSNAPNMTITPDFNVNGSRSFNVTAEDPSKENATVNLFIDLDFFDDAPFIQDEFGNPVPDFNIYEEIEDSITLTTHENDPELGTQPFAGSTQLTWKMQFANETNLTPVEQLTSDMFDMTITSSTDYLSLVPKANQTGTRNVTLYLFDNAGNNASQDITVSITNLNDAPVFDNLTDQFAQVNMSWYYNVSAIDSDPTSDTLAFSLVNVTPALNGLAINANTGEINYTAMTNGLFNITLGVCDNFNACTNETFKLTVSDTLAPLFGTQSTPANPSVYVFNATYPFSMSVVDNGNLSQVDFEFDSVLYNTTNVSGTFNVNITDLAAGSYPFRWIATDGASNTNSTNMSYFNVSKAGSALALTLNGTAGNITVSQGSTVPVVANVTNTTGAMSILNNGNSVTTGTTNLATNITFNTQGFYNITASFAGNQNYSASNLTYVVTVPDTVAPTFGTQTVSPTTPAKYTSLYQFRVDVTDNVGVNSVTLELDNAVNISASLVSGNTYEANASTFSIGNHTYKWFADDSASNVNSTSSSNYQVVKGDAVISLTMNGASGSTSSQVNDTVTFVANVTNPAGGNVQLHINGSQVQSGNSPITNVTNFTSTGVYTIMALFPGDANVNGGNVSYTLTVIPPISVASVSPASGSQFNYSSFTMNVDTSNVTTCAWDTSDVAQGSMTNAFSTSNGINHTANVSGLVLGSNSVHVACNNQSASTNTDLSYTVNNILDGSTLVGSNTITNTDMQNSVINVSSLSTVTGINNTLNNVTATNSGINHSVLTNCVISNSTVKDVVATLCSFTNSVVDPSDLTGSTVVGSTILRSNVTYSTVTNTAINDSEINSSAITGSTIVNSEFDNATVTNAVITNDVISTGTITVGNYTYDATTNGAANLSQVVPVPPQASFSQSMTTAVPQQSVTFTDASTDANVGGPLNDSLTYLWDFGDGTNATTQNASHAWSTVGTKTITFTVTDSYGLQDATTGTVVVSNPGSGGGGGGSGGGGGGGGGGAPTIPITSVPITRTVYIGQPLLFRIDGKLQSMPLLMRSATPNDQVTQWVANGKYFTVAEGGTQGFDVSKDGIADIDVTVLDVARRSATVSMVKSGAPVATNYTPNLDWFFNFAPTEPEVVNQPDVPVVAEPEPDSAETTVDVEADVEGPGMLSKVKEFITTKLNAKSVFVRGAIVVAVVLIGFAAYLLFLRWERF